MSEDSRSRITDALGVEPVEINANVFTAQNRKRLFWCDFYVPKPLERPSPKLADIIEITTERAPAVSFKDLPKNPPVNTVSAVNRNTATSVVKLRMDCKSNTLTCSNCYQTVVAVKGVWRHYTVKERERLQGLPDDYTAVPGLTDVKRCQLIGNAMCLPVMKYIMKQM